MKGVDFRKLLSIFFTDVSEPTAELFAKYADATDGGVQLMSKSGFERFWNAEQAPSDDAEVGRMWQVASRNRRAMEDGAVQIDEAGFRNRRAN